MARVCEICGKGPRVGNQVTIRGKAKYLGGVGTKITGCTRRTFKPNLQSVKVTDKGTNKTILACVQCIRSGSVVKAIKNAPFRLPVEKGVKKDDVKKDGVKQHKAKVKV